jgi:hypothetical protein
MNYCISDEYKSGKNCIVIPEDIYNTWIKRITRTWMVIELKTK